MPTRPQTHRPAEWMPREAYRHWYGKGVWQRLRVLAMQRDAYMCCTCGKPVGESGHIDHITPHRGNWDRFTDLDNLQTLCAACHSRKTQGGE